MTVRLVTDSVADLPPGIVQELGIMVVPLNVRFGTKVYRDGVDLTAEEFYERLTTNKTVPVTSVPTPKSFADTYDRLAEETDEIIVITVSRRLSGTYDVASQSIGLMTRKCHVEVVDSGSAIMAQGLVVITAARLAQAGAAFAEVMAIIKQNLKRVDMRATFDTLEYLKRGGRIGRAQALLGSVLHVNPIIGLKDSEVIPIGRERSRRRAIEHLYHFAAGYARIEELAVEYATTPEESDDLIERFGAIFPRERIFRSRASPVIGTHTGPGLLVVSVLGDPDKSGRRSFATQ